jgi:pyridoxamine 5'-phosphate oxidase
MAEFTEQDLLPNPIAQFQRWYQDAREANVAALDAMTVATATRAGVPSARMVLLKEADERGFGFYSNAGSQKGRELAENPVAALVIYWPELGRQVRVVGAVSQVAPEESDAYFASRARGSQLGAWASPQSQPLPDRAALDERVRQLDAKYAGQPVPRPAYWGGYRVTPSTIEFWQSRPNRLHDRFRYTRQPNGEWTIQRLAP